MSNDTSRYLRIYGYIGLLHRNYPNLKKIKKMFSKDSAVINTASGCFSDTMTISEAVNNLHLWYERQAYDIWLRDFVTNSEIRGYPKAQLLE